MLQPRKLAAIDIALLGPWWIVAEFAVGAVLPSVLGIWMLLRARSSCSILLGLYFVALGLNYLPLLIHAAVMTKPGSALVELGDEMNDTRRAMAKYRRQSLWLLVPFITPLAALLEWRREARSGHS